MSVSVEQLPVYNIMVRWFGMLLRYDEKSQLHYVCIVQYVCTGVALQMILRTNFLKERIPTAIYTFKIDAGNLWRYFHARQTCPVAFAVLLRRRRRWRYDSYAFVCVLLLLFCLYVIVCVFYFTLVI